MELRDPFARAGRINSMTISGIVRISEAAAELRAQGKSVIGLGAGEPDFPTPAHVIDAAFDAAKRGETKYTANSGTSALRSAIAAGVGAVSSEVLVSTGAKQTIFNAFMATLDEGCEVIVAAPYWTSYIDIIRIAEGTPVVVPTSDTGFKLTPESLQEAITPKTRWVLINNPGNPSGAVYSAAELEGLAAVVRANPHVAILSDEIYQHICYAPFSSFRDVAPDLHQRMLIVNGVSKSYAMTGWRIGWGIGPQRLIERMAIVQGQSTSGACSVSQAAALAAITGPDYFLAERNLSFQRRGQQVVRRLNEMAVLSCGQPDGAFYLFPSCEGAIGRTAPDGQRIQTDSDFCSFLLSEANVAVVPGNIFGSPGHFRMSYAYAEDLLNEACDRIQKACLGLAIS